MVSLARHCKIIVSCTYEDGNPVLMEDLRFLRQLVEDDNQFLEITALGKELAWKVMKLWMESAGRNLTNFQADSQFTIKGHTVRTVLPTGNVNNVKKILYFYWSKLQIVVDHVLYIKYRKVNVYSWGII
jgi:hypothetical protein